MRFEEIINLKFDSVIKMCDMQWYSELRFRRIAFYITVAWDKAGYHSSM